MPRAMAARRKKQRPCWTGPCLALLYVAVTLLAIASAFYACRMCVAAHAIPGPAEDGGRPQVPGNKSIWGWHNGTLLYTTLHHRPFVNWDTWQLSRRQRGYFGPQALHTLMIGPALLGRLLRAVCVCTGWCALVAVVQTSDYQWELLAWVGLTLHLLSHGRLGAVAFVVAWNMVTSLAWRAIIADRFFVSVRVGNGQPAVLVQLSRRQHPTLGDVQHALADRLTHLTFGPTGEYYLRLGLQTLYDADATLAALGVAHEACLDLHIRARGGIQVGCRTGS
jgi:hypothetical protein